MLIVIVATVGLISGYGRMSQTWDEPFHLAGGMEWLQFESNTLSTENPPLSRLFLAVGPYLAGARLPISSEQMTRHGIQPRSPIVYGNRMLYGADNYRLMLSLARLGNLPFFLLAVAVLWMWLRQQSPRAAFLGVALFCSTPAILAHGGLATTDMPFLAVFLLTAWRFKAWMEHASNANAVFFGISLGVCAGTKFTTLVFVPALMMAFLITSLLGRNHTESVLSTGLRYRQGFQFLLIVVPTAAFVVWYIYGFSTGTLADLRPTDVRGVPIIGESGGRLHVELANRFAHERWPAPEFFHGILHVMAHNEAGHPSYALGNVSGQGFWYYFPLAFILKTPLTFFFLLVVAVTSTVVKRANTQSWVTGLYLATLFIFLFMMNSNVTIGLRYVLVVYGTLSIAVASSLDTLLDVQVETPPSLPGSAFPWLVVIALCSQLILAIRLFPDYLPYFNVLAGDEPGRYLVDSDLDWGQGLFALERFFSEVEADALYIHLNGSAWVCDFDLPPTFPLYPGPPPSGWVAVSETMYRMNLRAFRRQLPCDASSMNSWDSVPAGGFDWLLLQEPDAYAGPFRLYQTKN